MGKGKHKQANYSDVNLTYFHAHPNMLVFVLVKQVARYCTKKHPDYN